MFYEALVIDNREYFSKGTIQVRASFFFPNPMNWDLSTDLQEVELGKEKDETTGKIYHQDFDAYLLAPLGGGQNYGTIILPQINERGYITFPENDLNNVPVWVGSYFKPILDENDNPTSTNIPSNYEATDGYDSLDNGTSYYNTDQKTNMLIRTKNTEYDKSDASKLKWSERPTTNIISISNEGIKARHFDQKDGWKENGANKFTDVNITDNEVKIQSTSVEDEKKVSIVLTDDVLEINKTGKDKTKITIDKDGNITVDTPKKIYFKNADKIEFLGNSRHLIGYEELYDALDTYICNHIHITPNGPSEGPLDASMAPLRAVLMNDMIHMKEKNLLTE